MVPLGHFVTLNSVFCSSVRPSGQAWTAARRADCLAPMGPITVSSAEHPSPIPAFSHEVRWIFDPDGVNSPFAYTMGLGARPGRA